VLEELRPLLYYPLGLLPTIFFTLRILVQWFQSEKHQRSYAGRAFWRLSFSGNVLLLLHYFIQVQYPFAILQVGNAVISWRNLNLLKNKNSLRALQVSVILMTAIALVTLLFMAQSYFLIGEFDWIRTPAKLYDKTREHHHPGWHVIGALGGILFSSRFWIQWWQAERHQYSELGKTFWWVSIIGSIISLLYFIRIHDTVSIVHYSFGLIPYLRNLILIRKAATV
jgi:lipid-A-disaccharide synthase-like uncharacterized protein